ncbi:MAG: GTPase HflX [Vampirovibrionia bacterium]
MSHEINKEIAVIINRRGQIINVTVGDAQTVKLSKFKNVREGAARLCGLRCIHTHPKSSPLSKLDLTALAKLRFDLIVAIGVDPQCKFSKKKGQQARFADVSYMAHLTPQTNDKGELWNVLEPQSIRELSEEDFEDFILELENQFIKSQTDLIKIQDEEKAVLVSLFTRGLSRFEVDGSLQELERLADTAGAKVLHTVIQKRPYPDSSYYLGSGKAEELSLVVQEYSANLVIVDSELSPRQQKNLEEKIGVKTIDRTELILDIFAQRAQTKEGKLQVELAQYKYLSPRLIGAGIAMSRQMGGGTSGGIATRGPGETKLETDRRIIKKRIQTLENEVEQIRLYRRVQRKKRESQNVITAALVGYTNSGKSTLLNALSDAEVFVEDKLFATLDPTTRRIVLPDHSYVLLSDTVGFIQRLPTSLIAAFRATLEEVEDADIILHVVDSSHPNYNEQIDTVYDVLTELNVHEKPIITLFNKTDKVKNSEDITVAMEKHAPAIRISAKERQGFGKLIQTISEISKKSKV